MSGCDTTSGVYNQGKLKAITILQKDPDLRSIVKVFNQPLASQEDIGAAGEKVLMNLYGYTKSTCLNKVRYFRYNNITSKQQVNKLFDLASLPPTSAAAMQHSYRVYLQV
ncbi:hypothetical protein RN001_008934 [Aquatica leii]|uniref:Uncharacterized protein n=1 Tax=Aquatica leii TaxID=1421715 RepID=A0AAN7QJB6_9COLE|nr:hypothetical protein RN001_008934 [Aquatica leii]